MVLSYCVTYLLEIFTDSLCSKPPPPSLDILWCKVLFFKTWISVVFSTVLSKKIENHKFSIFSTFLVPKISHFFENSSSKNTCFEELLRATASKRRNSFLEVFCKSCCSVLINAEMKYSFSAEVVQIWRA